MRNGPARARHRSRAIAHRRAVHGRRHRDPAGRNQARHASADAVTPFGEIMTSAAFDVLGIGNAIVDVISRTDDGFLAQHALTKGSMMLIDEARAVKLYGAMGPGVAVS